MKLVTSGLVVAALFTALPAAAQAPFGSLAPGQQIRVTDATGNRFTGRIDSVTSDRLTLDGRVLTTAQVAKIERKGDSIWNGVAIGAAVGLLFPLLPTEACDHQSRGGCIASGIESGALLGLAIDAIHRGYTTVYRADPRRGARLVPIIDGRRRAVTAQLIW